MYVNDDRDDVAFLTGSGSSKFAYYKTLIWVAKWESEIVQFSILGESGPVYSKRDLYERGHVAVCSHRQVRHSDWDALVTSLIFSEWALLSMIKGVD